jgi:hypothetical protein
MCISSHTGCWVWRSGRSRRRGVLWRDTAAEIRDRRWKSWALSIIITGASRDHRRKLRRQSIGLCETPRLGRLEGSIARDRLESGPWFATVHLRRAAHVRKHAEAWRQPGMHVSKLGPGRLFRAQHDVCAPPCVRCPARWRRLSQDRGAVSAEVLWTRTMIIRRGGSENWGREPVFWIIPQYWFHMTVHMDRIEFATSKFWAVILSQGPLIIIYIYNLCQYCHTDTEVNV